jgi:molybdate transport system regulatory protein
MTRLVFQLHFDAENRLGPGKIELLEKIEDTGSISAAGRAMNMSYRRAWLLVDALNRTFHAPVVATRLGGTSVGRATLTPLGREVVRLYREIGQTAWNAASGRVARLEELIAEGAKRVQPDTASATSLRAPAQPNPSVLDGDDHSSDASQASPPCARGDAPKVVRSSAVGMKKSSS